MIEMEIDGQKLLAEPGKTIIQVADDAGIYIPRFCYHKKLSIPANCRMCLVEVEKSNKPLPACATPITPNMKVLTQSTKTMEAQRAVMEYLLINHPLDCPICDQGGECELQDLALGYGVDHSDYHQKKRSVLDENLGPLVDTGMTRCIHCTRCVRFGAEIAGMRELGVTARGENMRIGTYIKHIMRSELSGNIIDLCPVGALTSKPYQYSARPWELCETPMVAPHDCIGSNLFVHSRSQVYSPNNIVMRVVPRENDAINETWISDRDRFSYVGLKHEDRILLPRLKKNGQWQEVSWREAVTEITQRLQASIVEQGSESIAGLISPSATLEECYLFQKYLRALGSPHIDHRFRLQDFSDQDDLPTFPKLGVSISQLANMNTILLVGASIRNEQPLLTLRLNQAYQRGARIMTLNPVDDEYLFTPSEKIITTDFINTLAQVLVVLADAAGEALPDSWSHVQPSEAAQRIAHQLKAQASTTIILMGEYALNHPQGAWIRQLIQEIARHTQAKVGVLTEGANSAGAWLAGAIPHRGPAGEKLEQTGLPASVFLRNELKRVYLVLGVEVEYDCSYSADALAALLQADYVVCLSSFITQQMQEYADVILPIATFAENDGTYVNVAGDWQSFVNATGVPYGEAKPAWKIIRQLARMMQLTGFDYDNTAQISVELKQKVEKMSDNLSEFKSKLSHLQSPPAVAHYNLMRIAPWPIYRVDALCRRSEPLQRVEAEIGQNAVLQVHPNVANTLQLKSGDMVSVTQGQQSIVLPLTINMRLAPSAVLIPSGLEETAGFGEAFAPVRLERSTR